MQEEERVPRLLDRLDLDRFQLKQYRNFDDCEYRSPSLSSKPPGKAYQLTYNHTFNQDLLITHLDIEFHQRDTFTSLFEVGEIEASKMTNRGMLGPVIRSNPPKSSRQERSLVVPCSCITQSLKVSLLLKKDFLVLFSDTLSLKKERSRQASEQNAQKIVRHTIRAINICGFQLSMSTGASELIPLLNISQAFKQSSRFQEAAETDVLVSLSLISARRFVQAAESLRNASKFYIEKYVSSKSSMDFGRIDKPWIRQESKEQLQISGFSRTFSSGRGLEGGRYLYKAAKLQLLLAETINQPTLLGEKLQAYNRANSFANGNITPIKLETRIDYEEVAYSIAPTIIPFLLKVLSDKAEIYKVSALKSIEFFYDILGCSLGNFMPLILKTLILVYPTLKERDESGLKIESGSVEKLSTSGRTKLLLDQTNHLLESLLSLLPGINKKCLKVMYQEIIQVSISEDYRNELRLYLLRFGERIMQICGSDLEIAVPYIRYLFASAQGKYTLKSDTSKHISHNLIYFSQRAIDLLKTKIMRQYNLSNSLGSITNWINQSLIALCENETVSSSSHLNHTLDLVIAVYMAPKRSLAAPIEPVVYLLNSSLNQPKLPFQKILQAFTVLVRHESRFQNCCELASEIIQRVLGRSKICSLGLKELRILEKLLDTVDQVKAQWLADFLDCIPHSNYDEIYAIFDFLVLKCVRRLDKQLISLIISTLFDQYTVKGKAHQQSKQLFISRILKSLPQSLSLLLQICLFENPQPQISDYLSKHAEPKEHCFDSKQFKLQSQLFSQKINLLVQTVGKNELVMGKMQEELSSQLVFQFYESSNQILVKSNNFKIKSKILSLIKHFIILIGQLPDDNPILKHKIFFCRTQLAVLRTFTTSYKDSKLQYYALINFGLLLQTITAIKSKPRDLSETTAIFDHEFTPNFQIPFPLDFTVQNLALYELSKSWPNLLPLLSSPLEKVRQMLIQILLHTFKRGLGEAIPNIRNKIIEQAKPLLASCLQSKDYSERLMAIRLFALLLGFGKEYKDEARMSIELSANLRPFLPLLQQVLLLEDDWNDQVSSCSRLIAQLCISSQLRARLLKRSKPNRKNSGYFDASSISINAQEDVFVDKKGSFLSLIGGLDVILKTDEDFKGQEEIEIPEFKHEVAKHLEEFRTQIEKINFTTSDNLGERDSFVEEEQFFDPNQERHSDKEKQINNPSDQEQLEFEDLGIIELDDQQWGEQQNEVIITQKLPLKKVYKLSPNLGSSAKHHHLRNKRMLPTKFEEEKIIIDQVQGRISSPPLQQPRLRPNDLREPFEQQQLPRMQFEQFEHQKNLISQDFNVSEAKNSSKKEKKGSKKRKISTAK